LGVKSLVTLVLTGVSPFHENCIPYSCNGMDASAAEPLPMAWY
jgi:hypothetical protein